MHKKYPAHQKRPRSGFTLVELLTVIAVIAVIAAILFPVFAKARDAAKRSTCQSNLRQIGMAIKLYVTDYDDTHPPERPYLSHDGWAFVIQPYLKNESVLQCPSEQTPANPDPGKTGYTDYLYNQCLLGRSGASFAAPTNTILCMDSIRGPSGMWDNGTDENSIDCHGDSTLPNATPGTAKWLAHKSGNPIFDNAFRHLEQANYLFDDGHVKVFPPLSIYNNCTAPLGKPTFAYK